MVIPTQSFGWLLRMSSSTEFIPAFSCQQWASWTVPGFQCPGEPDRKSTIDSGPNQKCSRGRFGLSVYARYGVTAGQPADGPVQVVRPDAVYTDRGAADQLSPSPYRYEVPV